MKTGIFFGSSTGHTQNDALKIAHALGVEIADVHNVDNTAPDRVADYDLLVLGTSTWGDGALQDDWYDFLAGLQAIDLTGKKIALFGTGDSSMGDTFCNAVGTLYDKLQGCGAAFVGEYPADCYDFGHSTAVRAGGGMAVGLLLDDMNRPELTTPRIEAWARTLKG